MVERRKCSRSCNLIIKSRPQSQQQEKTVRTIRRTLPILDQSRSSKIREDLFSGGSLSDVDDADLRPLQVHVLAYSDDAARSRDFSLVERCSSLLGQIRHEVTSRQSPTSPNTQNKVQSHEQGAADLDSRHRTDLDDLDRHWAERENRLTQRHNAEVADFDELWSGKKPRLSRKPSGGLLQMKQMERSAILVRDYATAREVHGEIDGRVQQEHKSQQRRLNADHRVEKLHLLQRQQNKLSALCSQKALEREVIERKYANDLEWLQKRKALHIDSHIGAERHKLPNQACWIRRSAPTLEIDPLLPPVAEKPKKRKRKTTVVRDTTTFRPLTMPNQPDDDQKYSTRFRGERRFRYVTSCKSATSQAESEVALEAASRRQDEGVEEPSEKVCLLEEEHCAEPGLSGGVVNAAREDHQALPFLHSHVVAFDTETECVAESVATGPSELSELEPGRSHGAIEKETNEIADPIETGERQQPQSNANRSVEFASAEWNADKAEPIQRVSNKTAEPTEKEASHIAESGEIESTEQEARETAETESPRSDGSEPTEPIANE